MLLIKIRRSEATNGIKTMRVTAVLAIVATLASFTASADVKRHEFIPEALAGSWAPSAEGCDKTDGSVIVLSAKSYVRSGASCSVDWVAETAGARGPIYSAHLQCPGASEGARKTASNVILVPTGSDQLSVGAEFSSLKTYRRCPTR